ncbi:MAG: NrfD/PsrC family molybdoenzyme membrane anchor subunit [Gemmatimonadota bacterium]
MLEITSTRHNPLVDPYLHVWSWEIPLYLFLGGIVAGLMILGGVALLRLARGEDPKSYFSMHAPWLAFMLLNIGMGALFLDLAHKLYVWAVYLTLQPTAPMSWGSWVLIIIYPLLLVSALIRLPEAWPWLARRVPALARWSSALLARPRTIGLLGWTNIVLGVAVGIYTGILLSTMVARPLWNVSILGPLFLVSGLSAGAALLHLMVAVLPPRRPAPQGLIGGAIGALIQPLGAQPPGKGTADTLIRADVAFLAVELLMLGLLLIGLTTASASHAAAFDLLMHGKYAVAFWVVLVGLGIVVPLALQGLELGRRIPHTVVPALLVLVGGYTLRWLMVNAGQVSEIAHAAAR